MTTPTPQAIERAAKAMYAPVYGEWYDGPCATTDSQKLFLEMAVCALSADLGDMVLAPKERT